jgi:fermentation-respiration switch protein FrsA (DUF1100 family)
MIGIFRSAGSKAGLHILALLLAFAGVAHAETIDTIVMRGHRQTLHVCGTRGAGDPIIVSSGDGGWVHLAPTVATMLAERGYFVVGFDTKAYLESFTTTTGTLCAEDEPADYRVLADYAQRGSTAKPILIGVSEGAGLSVLAATDPGTKQAIAGVIGLGLPDVNELGWRWRDAVIYITHGAPNEPSTESLVDRLSPLPLGAIHSTSDEFVSLMEVQRVLEHAGDPKRLWIVKAANHRFSDNLPELSARLFDAIGWVREHEPR